MPPEGEVTIGRSSRADLQIEDPMASRNHAVLRAGDPITIEDLDSANGTKLRAETIAPKIQVPLQPGDAIAIGSTVLMVQRARAGMGPRRMWSHSYFESRLEAECGQGEGRGPEFALVRLRLSNTVPWARVVPVLAEHVLSPCVFAAYGPRDYEILVPSGVLATQAALLSAVTEGLAPVGGVVRVGIARFPDHGRRPDLLMAHANAQLRSAGDDVAAPAAGATRSAAVQNVYAQAARAAASNINVLILGETGAGKEVLAREIHNLSPRAKKAFLAINCACLPEHLIESELFGYEKGAFTGAHATKPGLLESANEGTVFLDEIGELSMAVQARLLRVLETKEVMRVGSVKTRSIDVRFLAATNRNLEAESQTGKFRQDLFFRLNGISLTLPPLRERQDEIEALARLFLDQFSRELKRSSPGLSSQTLEILRSYAWPGNVRELRNMMERALILCDGDELSPRHLPLDRMRPQRVASVTFMSTPATPVPPVPEAVKTPAERLASEKAQVVDALARCAGNQSRAAKFLGISRRTLITRLDDYGIPRPQKESAKDDDNPRPSPDKDEDTE